MCYNFNLFIETTTLTSFGHDRVHNLLVDIVSLFDNRLRVFLCGKNTHQELCEKRFFYEGEHFSSPSSSMKGNPALYTTAEIMDSVIVEPSRKRKATVTVSTKDIEQNVVISEKKDDTADSIEAAVKLSKLQGEHAELLHKYNDLNKEFQDYKARIDLEKNQKLPLQIDAQSQTREIFQHISTEAEGTSKSVATIESQTKKVIMENTALTNIIIKLESDQRESVADRIHDFVRDFKCKVSYEKLEDSHSCSVQVVRGRHIMPIVAKVTFSESGKTMLEAKEAAFASLMSCLKKYTPSKDGGSTSSVSESELYIQPPAY